MSDLNRRQFLESLLNGTLSLGAVGALGSLGVGSMTSTRLFAQDAVAPTDKLGVMVVGCGGRGSGSHIPEFLNDKRTEIVAVCDADSSIAERAANKVAEKQGGKKPAVYKDMREGFANPAVDIVSCATANHWHALCTVWAIQAGKHVYVEKPICHNVHEGKAIVVAMKKYGKVCQVGSQCRSNPAILDSTKFVRDGGIGTVELARGLCYKRRKSIGALGEYTVPASVDYNFWSGPAPIVDPPTRPNFHYDWHWQRLYGNGDLGNQGPHQTDIARCYLGVDEFPSSVISYGGRFGYQTERNDPNYVDAGDTANTEVSIYNYANGKTLVFETRGLESQPYRGASIGVVAYGSEGFMVQVNYGLAVAYDLKGNVIKDFKGGKDSNHFDNFISAVINNDPSSLNADGRCGHMSAGISHLGNISYYLGEKNKVSVAEAKKVLESVPGNDDNLETLERTVEHLTGNKDKVDLEKTPLAMGPMLKFDPKNEVFIDNPDAEKLATREYRGEFVVPELDKV